MPMMTPSTKPATASLRVKSEASQMRPISLGPPSRSGLLNSEMMSRIGGMSRSVLRGRKVPINHQSRWPSSKARPMTL